MWSTLINKSIIFVVLFLDETEVQAWRQNRINWWIKAETFNDKIKGYSIYAVTKRIGKVALDATRKVPSECVKNSIKILNYRSEAKNGFDFFGVHQNTYWKIFCSVGA